MYDTAIDSNKALARKGTVTNIRSDFHTDTAHAPVRGIGVPVNPPTQIADIDNIRLSGTRWFQE